MSLAASKKIDVSQIDKRVLQRFLAEGKVSAHDYEAYLASLSDMSAGARDLAEIIAPSDIQANAKREGKK